MAIKYTENNALFEMNPHLELNDISSGNILFQQEHCKTYCKTLA